MPSRIERIARTACAGGTALVLVTCCSCSGNSSSGSSATGTSSATSTPSAPQLSLGQINNSFSAMSALKPLAAKGKGRIAVILPVTTDKHFAEFDAPYLKESFKKAGLKPSQYVIPPPSDPFDAVKTAIAKGASVLIVDTRGSGDGVQIEQYAKAHGVPVIDYDWLTLGGTRQYYVGFDSFKIGVLLGLGLVNCVSAWKVTHPRIIVMTGGPTDYNSAMYAQGYGAVLARKFPAGWTDVSNPPGTWDPPIALSEFEQQYAAHNNINAALIPNDENGAPIISYLEHKGIKPRTFPTTGLDATLAGLQNILAGYQCGTVYKPIYLEAQAAAALAMYLRARVTPPPSLLNWHMTDPQTNKSVASVLLTPEWVTTQNMKSTVIADKFVSTSQLCAGKFASACSAAGIGAPEAAFTKPTTVSVTVKATKVTAGTKVIYLAAVTPKSDTGTPTGTISFTTGSTKLCTATLSDGVAACGATNAPAGTDTVTGTYPGGGGYASSSGTATLTVK